MGIEYNGEMYTLRYGLKRIEIMENATKTSVMAELSKTNGILSISKLKSYFAYGLMKEGADAYMPPKKALEIANDLIEVEGFMQVTDLVAEALERDCPFFFRGV